MRKKELKLVITFHTTAEAMAMEMACSKEGISGRLIPVPRQISSGCGLAWSMALAQREEARSFMEKQRLSFESFQECMLS